MFRGTLDRLSTKTDGRPVALVIDVFREDTKELITDHVWFNLKPKQLASLTAIKNNTPIRFSARVKEYGQDKYGLDLGNLYVWSMVNRKVKRGEYPK